MRNIFDPWRRRRGAVRWPRRAAATGGALRERSAGHEERRRAKFILDSRRGPARIVHSTDSFQDGQGRSRDEDLLSRFRPGYVPAVPVEVATEAAQRDSESLSRLVQAEPDVA